MKPLGCDGLNLRMDVAVSKFEHGDIIKCEFLNFANYLENRLGICSVHD